MSTSNILSVVAIMVSLIAACFTGLLWREAHSQLVAATKPSLNFEVYHDTESLPVGIGIFNAGAGPARIKSVTYFVDKKPFADAGKALDSVGSFPDVYWTAFDDYTLGANTGYWVLDYPQPHGKVNQKELDDFMELLHHHLAVQFEFCPQLAGECSKQCSQKGWCD